MVASISGDNVMNSNVVSDDAGSNSLHVVARLGSCGFVVEIRSSRHMNRAKRKCYYSNMLKKFPPSTTHARVQCAPSTWQDGSAMAQHLQTFMDLFQNCIKVNE